MTLKQHKLPYFLWVDIYKAICEQLEESENWTRVIPMWKNLVNYTEHTNQYAVHSISLMTQRLLTDTEVNDYELLSGPILNVIRKLSLYGDRLVVYYSVPL